jgi:hypothetical protein
MSKFISWGMCLLFGLLLVGCSEATKTMDKAKDAASAAAKSTEALKGVPGAQELLTKVTDLFGSATKSLQAITDVDSAKAVVPKLEELTGSTDSLSQAIGSLPKSARSAIAAVVENGITELKALVEKIEAIPGVSAVIKPTIDKLMEKLSTLAA